ncbi:MAG: 30S ribosomal protein S8e [Methanolobus sp.]|jgi:small subunit ribosomal protein S8e|uniref:30S ribosomal protein S8e n=1 Tax=Methanolobus sp. TaxID=1874737 RepID=UPI00028ADA04|nr:30S ribosomal protein S8e [Methanolobus sp.]AFV25006.1 30S ribosomal protein S8e [Methanolobus psychrophilus R15]MDP2216857.1 30S ribosomal protein S8e [Methanolobus sp.]
MKWQGRSRRSYTGAKIKAFRSKRKHELGRESADTRIAVTKRKNVSTTGGNRKVRLMQCDVVNVTDAQGRTQKTTMTTVIGNTANEHYVRRNILTRGSVVKTALGNAKVTSRPGQDGVVNAVLIE